MAWTEDRDGTPRAVLVGLRPFPGVRSASPGPARAWARWVTGFLTRARPAIEQLAAQGVTPAAVLGPIGRIEWSRRAWERFHARPDNARQRRRDAKALDRAAAVLERWEPVGPLVHHDGPGGSWGKVQVADHLRAVAAGLRASAPARGAPPERVLLVAARVLDVVICDYTGRSDITAVDALLRAAWPGRCDWDPYDLDAARKLLARARAQVSLAAVRRIVPDRGPEEPLGRAGGAGDAVGDRGRAGDGGHDP